MKQFSLISKTCRGVTICLYFEFIQRGHSLRLFWIHAEIDSFWHSRKMNTTDVFSHALWMAEEPIEQQKLLIAEASKMPTKLMLENAKNLHRLAVKAQAIKTKSLQKKRVLCLILTSKAAVTRHAQQPRSCEKWRMPACERCARRVTKNPYVP